MLAFFILLLYLHLSYSLQKVNNQMNSLASEYVLILFDSTKIIVYQNTLFVKKKRETTNLKFSINCFHTISKSQQNVIRFY